MYLSPVWVHSAIFEISVFSLSSLEDKLMSMNSDSVYIWSPPRIDSSTLNSNTNSLPWFWGFDFKAFNTSFSSSAESL